MRNLKKRFCTLALDFPGTIIAHLDTKISLLLCTFIKKILNTNVYLNKSRRVLPVNLLT